MGLETATFIHELDASNPVGASDPKGQGDDHIRVMKGALLNTFPNIEGVVTSSHGELNKLTGATPTTAEINKLAGLTASTAELNKLTGVTALAADLNKTAALIGTQYTPTLTAVAGVANVANGEHSYIRVGNTVLVFGYFTVDNVGTVAISRTIGISLPVASAFSSEVQAAGVGVAVLVGNFSIVASVIGDATNDRLQLVYIDGSDTGPGRRVTYGALYRVL